MKKYIFGPVPSRRLGLSLGVDLVPYKTCTLDCVYCECGATNNLTVARKEYVPIDQVIAELDAVLSTDPEIDYITFSGAGEPTLNSKIGEVIAFVKNRYPEYKLCLLTNATLLGDAGVVEEISDVDLVIPSLDAVSQKDFDEVNRPELSLDIDCFVRDLVSFRKNCSTAMWVEVFVVGGVNDSDESIAAFADVLQQVKPDKIQLNMLDRPGTEAWVEQPSEDVIEKFIAALEPIAPLNVVGSFNYVTETEDKKYNVTFVRQRIIEMVSRRPCTAKDLAFSLCVPDCLVTSIIEELLTEGSVVCEREARGEFYRTISG